MTKGSYLGRTTVVASGGKQVSITYYRRSWFIVSGVMLGLALVPSGAGPIAISVCLVAGFIPAVFLARFAVRRIVTVQIADWVDLDEHITFERAAFGTDPAAAGYIPRPGVVARELNKCRKGLISVALSVVVLAVTFTAVGVTVGTPVTRMVLITLCVLLFGSSMIQVRKRARAVRTLQHLDVSV